MGSLDTKQANTLNLTESPITLAENNCKRFNNSDNTLNVSSCKCHRPRYV